MALAGLLEISGQADTLPPLVGFQGADIVGSIQVSNYISTQFEVVQGLFCEVMPY